MTLKPIVTAFGGDLYQGGGRASIPAPGHSAADRSVSLCLAGDRVLIHGFGAADWRIVRDELMRRGFIDADGRLTGAGQAGGPAPPRPDGRVRVASAEALWDGAVRIDEGTPAARYLLRRGVRWDGADRALRRHPGAPTSVYRAGGRRRPALIARISDADDVLTAVELTYLEPNGRPATDLRLGRKTVGLIPAGAAVRLAPAAAEMLVAEGVMTTLSAMARFQLPGWALTAAGNLAAWSAPVDVRRVLIAADRGTAGEAAATRLFRRLRAQGVSATAVWPDAPFGDWNEAEVHAAQSGEEGRGGAPVRRG